MNFKEHAEQVNFVKWFKLQYPQFEDNITCSIAGANLGARVGARMKAAGYKKGWPDLQIAIATKSHPGLFIEMKVGGKKPTKDQERVMFMLSNQGYKVSVCQGWLEAKEVVEGYLDGYRERH